jgi:hypothetical protein
MMMVNDGMYPQHVFRNHALVKHFGILVPLRILEQNPRKEDKY